MLTAAVLLLAASAAPDCANAMTDADMQACSAADLKQAEAALASQWRKTGDFMKRRDSEWKKGELGKYDQRTGFYASLLASQRGWIAYRQNFCAVEGYKMRGGTGEQLEYLGCMITMAEARTKELADLVRHYNGE